MSFPKSFALLGEDLVTAPEMDDEAVREEGALAVTARHQGFLIELLEGLLIVFIQGIITILS